jgi:hypothetical protein
MYLLLGSKSWLAGSFFLPSQRLTFMGGSVGQIPSQSGYIKAVYEILQGDLTLSKYSWIKTIWDDELGCSAYLPVHLVP